MLRCFVSLFILFFSLGSLAQEYSSSRSTLFNHYDRYAYSMRDSFHTSVKPYSLDLLKKEADIDSLYFRPVKTKAGDILWNRPLVSLQREDLSLAAHPLFNFQASRDYSTSGQAFINMRGAMVSGFIGERFFFSTSFYEHQASYLPHQKQLIDSLGVVPGQGKPKPFKDTAYDYAYSQAYLSYSPSSVFNLQLGYGKHFIGEGYRSLLLSDNSFSYPYFKWTADVWRLKYTGLWAQFQEPNISAPNTPNPKKWGAFHILDINASKWLNIGLFEAVIWENANDNGYRGFDASYAVPLLFRRPVEYANGSPDNVLLGINGKISLSRSIVLFGQLSVDEFLLAHVKARDGWWANKYGVQAGVKIFDVVGIRHLDVQAEYSSVRPFTYTHFTAMQNYGHYGQPLAHPLGANFSEAVGLLKYSYRRIFFQSKTTFAVSGLDDPTTNYGGNIYKEYTSRTKELGNTIGQGVRRKLFTQGVVLSYLINPQVNTNVSIGADLRRETIGEMNSNVLAFSLALSTSLSDFNFDY